MLTPDEERSRPPRPEDVDMIWISDRMGINPSSILWVFRGAHGELEITFAGAKQLTLNEHELTSEGRAFLLPAEDHDIVPTAPAQRDTLRIPTRAR